MSAPLRSNEIQSPNALNATTADERTHAVPSMRGDMQLGLECVDVASADASMHGLAAACLSVDPPALLSPAGQVAAHQQAQLPAQDALHGKKPLQPLAVQHVTSTKPAASAKRAAPAARGSGVKRHNAGSCKQAVAAVADDQTDNSAAQGMKMSTALRAKRQCRPRAAAVIDSCSDIDIAKSDGSPHRPRLTQQRMPLITAGHSATADSSRHSRAARGQRVSAASDPGEQAENGSSGDDAAWASISSGDNEACRDENTIPDSPEVLGRKPSRSKRDVTDVRSTSGTAKTLSQRSSKAGCRWKSDSGTGGPSSGRGGSSSNRGGLSSGRGAASGGKGGTGRPAARRQNFVRNNLKVHSVLDLLLEL